MTERIPMKFFIAVLRNQRVGFFLGFWIMDAPSFYSQ